MLGTPWLEWFGIVRAIPTYLIVAAAVFGGILLVRLAEKRVVARWKRAAAESVGTLDDVAVDVLDRALLPLIYYGVFTLGIVYLDVPLWVERAVRIVGLALVGVLWRSVATTIISHAVNRLAGRVDGRHPAGAGGRADRQVAVVGLALIFLLDNLGVQVGAAIAGLGIGGIAVALAAQAILGDLISYVAIVFDRRFHRRLHRGGRHLHGLRRAHRHQDHPRAQRERRAHRVRQLEPGGGAHPQLPIHAPATGGARPSA